MLGCSWDLHQFTQKIAQLKNKNNKIYHNRGSAFQLCDGQSKTRVKSRKKERQWKSQPLSHTLTFSHINICYSSAVPREHPRDSHRALPVILRPFRSCCPGKEIPGNRPSFPSVRKSVPPKAAGGTSATQAKGECGCEAAVER